MSAKSTGMIKTNYNYELSINTTPGSETATMAPVAEGFDNIAESLSEVLYQSSFLGDGGWGRSEVTGGQLILTLSGVRVVGDAAQDYIFGDAVYFGFGENRKTDAQLTCPDGSTISCGVTLASPDFKTLPLYIYNQTAHEVKFSMYALCTLIIITILVLLIAVNLAGAKKDKAPRRKPRRIAKGELAK